MSPKLDFVGIDAHELAAGWLTGHDFVGLPPSTCGHHLAPRRAFEAAVLSGLTRPPYVVRFSGGRDSSVILAVAMQLAQREGLPQPVAVTFRYPGAEAANEDDWQELVIRHLGVKEWHRIDHRTDGHLLNSAATDGLRKDGVVWPPTLHSSQAATRLAAGGVVVTGEGGDETFGTKRVLPLTGTWRTRPKPSRRLAAAIAGAAAPRQIRLRRERQDYRNSDDRLWLEAAFRNAFYERLAQEQASEPLSWEKAVWRHLGLRALRVGRHNLAVVAARQGVELSQPFLDPQFVSALGRSAGAWGFLSRAQGLLAVFGDLLPEEVLRRQSKARFHQAHVGEAVREFARSWDGGGIDPLLVADPEALRAEWLSSRPRYSSFCLLQQAWLHQHGKSA